MSEVFIVFEDWGYDGLCVDSVWSTLDAATNRAEAADNRWCEIVVKGFGLDGVDEGRELCRRAKRPYESGSTTNPLVWALK